MSSELGGYNTGGLRLLFLLYFLHPVQRVGWKMKYCVARGRVQEKCDTTVNFLSPQLSALVRDSLVVPGPAEAAEGESRVELLMGQPLL